MTSARLGQQLTLDFSATVTPASGTQEPLAASSLFGRIPQPGLPLWSAPEIRPAEADVSEPLTAEPPKPEPAKPEPLTEIPSLCAPVAEPEQSRNQHNYVTVRRSRLTLRAEGVAGWWGETTSTNNPHGSATSHRQ